MRFAKELVLLLVYLSPVFATTQSAFGTCVQGVAELSAEEEIISHIRTSLGEFIHPQNLAMLEEWFPTARPVLPVQTRYLAGLNLVVALKGDGSVIRRALLESGISFRFVTGTYKFGPWTSPGSQFALKIPLSQATLAEVESICRALVAHSESFEEVSVLSL